MKTGVLSRAKDATERTGTAQVQEEIQLALTGIQVEGIVNELSIAEKANLLKTELLKNDDDAVTEIVNNTDIKVKYKGYETTIKADGSMTQLTKNDNLSDIDLLKQFFMGKDWVELADSNCTFRIEIPTDLQGISILNYYSEIIKYNNKEYFILTDYNFYFDEQNKFVESKIINNIIPKLPIQSITFVEVRFDTYIDEYDCSYRRYTGTYSALVTSENGNNIELTGKLIYDNNIDFGEARIDLKINENEIYANEIHSLRYEIESTMESDDAEQVLSYLYTQSDALPRTYTWPLSMEDFE